MTRYIGKRLLNAIVILLIATIRIFAMVKALGLNPVLATLSGGRMSEEILNQKPYPAKTTYS